MNCASPLSPVSLSSQESGDGLPCRGRRMTHNIPQDSIVVKTIVMIPRHEPALGTKGSLLGLHTIGYGVCFIQLLFHNMDINLHEA